MKPSPAADPAWAEITARDRQARLIDRLACPSCRDELVVGDAIERHGAIVRATLRCSRCGEVGRIEGFKPTFLQHDDRGPATGAGDVVEPVDLTARRNAPGWWPVGDGLCGDGIGTRVAGTIRGRGVRFHIGSYEWGGRVLLRCGDAHRLVDTYGPVGGDIVVELAAGQSDEYEWSVEIVEGRPPGSCGDQALLRAVGAMVAAEAATAHRFVPANRGNPYPPRFDALLRGTASDAFVLDVGGGDRVHPDPRVLNLEYLPYRGPDLYGDGLRLPIRSGSVDLILSQAVLEHVPDPGGAVRELRRIMRPGGVVYAEIAFMQPLHAVPFHFFNVTPHGLDLLFADFEVLASGTFGGLAETVGWFFRLVDAGARIGQERAARALSTMADLDRSLSAADLSQFASAVYVEAIKPEC